MYIEYIETVLKAVAFNMLVATALLPNPDFKVVSVNPISDQIKRLQVISCDICNAANASYDVFVDGVIREITVLKRCCEKCVQSFNQDQE